MKTNYNDYTIYKVNGKEIWRGLTSQRGRVEEMAAGLAAIAKDCCVSSYYDGGHYYSEIDYTI